MSRDTPSNLTADDADFVFATGPQVVHHRSARKRRPVRTTRMQLNLTSMIDVIFLLLIYFVVTASFTVGEGVITARLPAGTGMVPRDTRPPERPLNVVLKSTGFADCFIAIDGAGPINNFGELAGTLIALQYDPPQGRSGVYRPDNPVLIRPDGQVRWQHVVNAFNATVKARYSNVAFATTGSS